MFCVLGELGGKEDFSKMNRGKMRYLQNIQRHKSPCITLFKAS